MSNDHGKIISIAFFHLPGDFSTEFVYEDGERLRRDLGLGDARQLAELAGMTVVPTPSHVTRWVTDPNTWNVYSDERVG